MNLGQELETFARNVELAWGRQEDRLKALEKDAKSCNTNVAHHETQIGKMGERLKRVEDFGSHHIHTDGNCNFGVVRASLPDHLARPLMEVARKVAPTLCAIAQPELERAFTQALEAAESHVVEQEKP